MNDRVRFGLPKGRLFDQCVTLLANAGVTISSEQLASRLLLFPDRDNRFEFVCLKPVDIPVYVESGVIDAGIVGTDILRELDSDVYEPLDLRIGRCKLTLAAKHETTLSPALHLRIATKYPKTTQRYFARRNMPVQVVKLEGSVEIAPLLGLADAIVDLVETGRTLRENGLQVIADISPVTAKLIINRTSMKIQSAKISQFIAQLDAVVYAST